MQRRIDEETIPGGRGERGHLAYSFLNHVCYQQHERLLPPLLPYGPYGPYGSAPYELSESAPKVPLLKEVSQEGKRYHLGRVRRPANVDLEACLGRRAAAVHRSERDPHAQARGHRAARHAADVDSTRKDTVAGPRDSTIVHPHAREARIVVARPLRLERLATDERTAPFHDPGAVHLERRLVSVEVLAREEEALLEAKGVPCAEADRLDPEIRPGLQERFPDPQSLGRHREELEPRLARVAGSGNEERRTSTGNGGVPRWWDGRSRSIRFPPPLDFRWNGARMGAPRGRRNEVDRDADKRLDAAQIHRRETLKEIRGARTLEGQAEPFRRAIRESDVRARVRREPGPDRCTRPCVAHEQEPVGREARHDDVVEDRAVFAQEMRVPRFTRQRGHIVRAEAIEERVCLRPIDENLAHVTHVEQADRAAHGEMLVHDPGILEGHLPSAELDHARPRPAVPFEQRGAQRHDGASRASMKASLRAKLMAAPHIARGHHGPVPGTPLRAELPHLRPGDPRDDLFVDAISNPDPEPRLAPVDPSDGRRLRGLGGVLGLPRGPRRRLLFRRHDPERARVRTSPLDAVERDLREEHGSDRGAHVRSPALRLRAAVPRQETGVPDQRLITRWSARGGRVRGARRTRDRAADSARRPRSDRDDEQRTRPPCARTTSGACHPPRHPAAG